MDVVVAVLIFLLGLAALAAVVVTVTLSAFVLWATSSDRRAEKAERWIRRWKERDR